LPKPGIGIGPKSNAGQPPDRGHKVITLRTSIAQGLRHVGLLGLVDDVLARSQQLRTFRLRHAYQDLHPDFVLPPADIAYDAFGPWTPAKYRAQGASHADYITELIQRHRPEPQSICEWGCGPMRVLRHMPTHFPRAKLTGLDYNPRTIQWCKANFDKIDFVTNGLEPPLPLASGTFDVIYAISVFTHLSERNHRAFARDLIRCLAPDGILIVTLHGDRYADKLTRAETTAYQRGHLVVRDHAIEGKRTFVAFHSRAYVRELFRQYEIVEHDVEDRIANFRQDTWVIRRGARVGAG
jgi:SAM-dependent methyltransferase